MGPLIPLVTGCIVTLNMEKELELQSVLFATQEVNAYYVKRWLIKLNSPIAFMTLSCTDHILLPLQ